MNVTQIRAATGVVAANVLLVSIVLGLSGGVRALVFAVGWGLAILCGVMSRHVGRLARGEQTAAEGTWSGVLIASLLWQGLSTPVLFPTLWRSVLDASALPLAIVYIGAKIGCYQMACCGWRRRLPLQLVEIGWTVLSLAVAIATPGPAGVSFCVFMALHFMGWQAAKALRVAQAHA